MGKNKHRVLVVDDEPDIVEILKYNLEKDKHHKIKINHKIHSSE